MKLKTLYRRILIEAGEAAGQYELHKVSLDQAVEYCKKMGVDVPNLELHLKLAQKLFGMFGKTQRADMPVIDEKDVRDFQAKIKNGYIDFNDPFSDRTDPNDPFPQGLEDKDATNFMSNGLRDKNKPDDRINVSTKRIKAKDLRPIQAQVYLDKSVKSLAKNGIEASRQFLSNSTLITSSDNNIIDGHHRYLSALILDPDMEMKCLVVDVPIKILLPLATAYGDARGNERNV